jgi:integrase/recombinase XerD
MPDDPNHTTTSPSIASDVSRYVERFLRYLTLERVRSHNTIAAYRGDLGIYQAFLDGRGIGRVSDISEAEVQRFVEDLEGTPRTINRRISSIRSFHRFLVEENVVSTDLTKNVLCPAVPDRLPKALRIDQVADLLESVSGDDPISLRDRALLELLYATGARISEVVGLAVDDVVDMGGGAVDAIRVTGKGNKQRIVPLGSHAQAAVEAWLVRGRPVLAQGSKISGPALFLGSRGGPLSRQNAWLILKDRADKSALGLTLSPHTLRHSCATHLIQGGADVRVVQELLGHQSVTTTQIYTKVTIDSLRDVFHTAHPRAR